MTVKFRDSFGRLHHDTEAAVIDQHGTMIWYRHGKIHRKDGPAIIFNGRGAYNGGTCWYNHGKLHRIGGPAMEYRNSSKYYKNNKLHREDGPAIIWGDGEYEWYLNGCSVSPEQLPVDFNYLKLKYEL